MRDNDMGRGGRHHGWMGHRGGEGRRGRGPGGVDGSGDGPGRGRGARMFEHGALRFVLLKLIGDQPSHGYELIKAVEEKMGGRYSPSPGVVYPTLTLLEELGYVTVAPSDGARKLYTITDAGRSFLAENQQTVDAIFARMAARRADANEAEQPDRAPQIIRAVENLRLALRLRLARTPLSEETINAIAGTLDAAAQSLERL